VQAAVDAVFGRSGGLLTTADLAAREDFAVGEAVVSPSRRIVRGPGGSSDVEPRVMQVLVVLADAAGHVVTRDTLFQRCWGGVYVGDDSLNRAIGSVRKLAGDIGGGSFQIETIPRTGYRLTVTSGARPVNAAGNGAPVGSNRRLFIGGAPRP
jgi:DNA-binding winged helix-turn-helix (wHTH) protein